MSFFEGRRNVLRDLQRSAKRRILQKNVSLYVICAIKLRIDWGTPETFGVTGESVEQFEGMLFFERRNNFIRCLQISPKGRILQKHVPLYEIWAIKLRILQKKGLSL